jgi:TIR domain-containing protein
MDYEYDAFFSYKRDRESDYWHKRVKEKLAYWAKQGFNREIRIFFDTEEIQIGQLWEEKIGNALKKSRCIVCFWSPQYFQSKWCVSEWETFLERERIAKRALVVPVSYFDGNTFPPDAKARQFPDVSKFTSTMERFWDTDLAVNFEDEQLKPLADALAVMIRNAPAYKDTFPIVVAKDSHVQPEGTIERAARARR